MILGPEVTIENFKKALEITDAIRGFKSENSNMKAFEDRLNVRKQLQKVIQSKIALADTCSELREKEKMKQIDRQNEYAKLSKNLDNSDMSVQDCMEMEINFNGNVIVNAFPRNMDIRRLYEHCAVQVGLLPNEIVLKTSTLNKTIERAGIKVHEVIEKNGKYVLETINLNVVNLKESVQDMIKEVRLTPYSYLIFCTSPSVTVQNEMRKQIFKSPQANQIMDMAKLKVHMTFSDGNIIVVCLGI